MDRSAVSKCCMTSPFRVPAANRRRVNHVSVPPNKRRADFKIFSAAEGPPSAKEGPSVFSKPSRLYDLSEATTSVQAPQPTPTLPSKVATPAIAAAGVLALAAGTKYILDRPSRAYDNNVGEEYDAWTEEGVLEYYWGEHIHLGYYTDEERAKGYKKKDFIEAKKDFVYEMLKWSECEEKPARILDCGCGIGGTSRLLAKNFPDSKVTGITLSPNQVKRGTELAKEQNLPNVEFKVMNALEMEFEDNTFDLVWACESGEHMPDKKKYVESMTRVLKPGGSIVIATWCQREEGNSPFTEDDKENLRFLYEEWAHPYFVSKEEYVRLMEGTGSLEKVKTEDWVKETIDSWRHSIWVGVWDPWIVVFKGPGIWYKTVREIVTLERMHRAFDRGLMEYGMMKGKKKAIDVKED
ncbi:hypothetical protein CYMTET_6474 [Cymbomonas tetramitiformis]|uniref:Methyltransferase domain-containing protein n=1 Tax=Cymbomonas tetramitiformis TaxID=36881 RepID=A0AAE0GU48_9CHLO|nr:hypothetical protein CYMTET_7883 [Cymbomonas tetramitiformis]KAK3285943.1 hypothetical protein CYMTET_6474 [Cymbomonas tetramitiformis]